jgi:predicted Zn-dependent protease
MSPGYKIEKGKITGRLKTPWFPGTYTSAENIAALGKEAKWVGGALHIPLFTVPVYR